VKRVIPLLLLLTIGCGKQQQDVTVFVSGDTAGWITPCGCTSNQSGGLSRRATLIDQQRQSAPTMVLDVGGAVTGNSPYDLVKLRAILAGQMKMGLDAFNLGGPESRFTATQLRSLQSELEIPFVSANLRDGDGKPIAPAIRMFARGGQQVAVTGVVDPEWVGDDLSAGDPYRSVFEAIRDVEADRIIVLAYLPEPQLKELAKKLPDVDAVLGGPTGQVVPPSLVGHVLVGSSTNKGKFLLQMRLPSAGKVSADVIEVASTIEMSEPQQDNLQSFYQQLAKNDFSPAQTQFVSTRLLGSSRQTIAGSDACNRCHQLDNSVWHDSKHAHAWQSLQTTGAQVDPACQRCHTTGYGLSGGFQTIASSRQLVSVGCENCHGPSQQHAAEPTVRTPFVAKEQCVACHDHENSPHFEYAGYWSKITHGKAPDPSKEQASL
jgi:2',3'-cyclic-nucleotide 2'-phosphodiesterase (5'-nucleotidase family)